jgi:CopA family copper-resistance protein
MSADKILSIRKTSTAVLIFLILFLVHIQAQAAIVEYDLTIAQEDVSIQGKTTLGMTINGQIPGPTLRFTEGDVARIRVHNTMDVSTSIHWHGILVPPKMDGVPLITQIPIKPGTTFTYEIPIRQTGTYWYHSHSSLQEQSGLYGSIVISAKEKRTNIDKDYVVLLSDWTTDKPHTVLRSLKRGSEWYALQKGSAQSVFGAVMARRLGDYLMRELQRMPPMDIADVAYDYFLANGKPQIDLPAEPSNTVRLRIIDGSATTYFHLEFSGGPMTIVSADGLDIEPLVKQRFLIGVAETYDVLVTVPESGSYELRATAHDGSGHTSVWIGSGMRHPAPAIPNPNLYDSMHHVGLLSLFSLTPAGTMGMPDSMVEKGMFDEPGMMGMHGMDHRPDHSSTPPSGHPMHDSSSSDMKTEHDTMPSMEEGATMGTAGKTMKHTMDRSMGEHTAPVPGRQYGSRVGFLEADIASRDNLARDGSDLRPWTPYDQLRAPAPTFFPKDKPVRDIRLTLDGDMERYVWFMNNKPLSETDHILIKEGEVVRFIMINRTMMHHPMHLHGHFFRVVNAQGHHAPLKHTVDVAPMSTTVIEFYAGEVGDWFFHCHLLYHMKSGMARLIHYQDFTPDPGVQAVRHKLNKDPWYFWGEADALSNMTEGSLTLANTRTTLEASWEVGWQEVDDTEWEGITTIGWYMNRFTSFFAGVDVMGEGSDKEEARGVFGLSYLLPLNLETSAWVDTEGGTRVMLEKELELTPRFGLHGEVEFATHKDGEGAVSLHYMLTRDVSLVGKWHSDFGYGGGIQIRF